MLKVSRILAAKYYSGSIWVSPTGEIIDARDNHVREAEILCKANNIDTSRTSMGYSLVDLLLKKGWLRIGSYAGDVYLQAWDWNSTILSRAQDVLKVYPGRGAWNVMVQAENIPSKEVPFEEFQVMGNAEEISQYSAA